MEHEVFVPFPAGTVRQALVDPARIARCVPGLQLDADEDATSPDTLTGRLQVRIAGSSITYRGTLRITEQDDGDLAVTGEGKEARGGGSAKLDLTVRPTSADSGTTLGFTGTVTSEGRLAESDDAAVTAAARRILDRFGTRLAALLEETSSEAGDGDADADAGKRPGEDAEAAGGRTEKPEAVNGSAGATSVNGSAHAQEQGAAAGPETGAASEREAEAEGREVRQDQGEAAPEPEAAPEEPGPSATAEPEAGPEADAAPDTDAEPDTDSAPDTDAVSEEPEAPTGGTPEPEPGADTPAPGTVPGAGADGEPAAPDGALARRTMIGRSAEEVDHAPPRGRYAPVPPPEPPVVAVTLRWAAPAAAVAVASAVVLGRLLRRRRR